jgi:hypothetical protein
MTQVGSRKVKCAASLLCLSFSAGARTEGNSPCARSLPYAASLCCLSFSRSARPSTWVASRVTCSVPCAVRAAPRCWAFFTLHGWGQSPCSLFLFFIFWTALSIVALVPAFTFVLISTIVSPRASPFVKSKTDSTILCFFGCPATSRGPTPLLESGNLSLPLKLRGS